MASDWEHCPRGCGAKVSTKGWEYGSLYETYYACGTEVQHDSFSGHPYHAIGHKCLESVPATDEERKRFPTIRPPDEENPDAT